MGALDIISSVTASITPNSVFSVHSLEKVLRAVETSESEPDVFSMLAAEFDISEDDLVEVGDLMSALKEWIVDEDIAEAESKLEACSYNTLFFVKSILAPIPEKNLYYAIRDKNIDASPFGLSSVLVGDISKGNVVRRVRSNKFMHWSYELKYCQMRARQDARTHMSATVVKALASQLAILSNRPISRRYLQIFADGLSKLHHVAYIERQTVASADSTRLVDLCDAASNLYAAMHRYRDECEVITYGEHSAVCRVVYHCAPAERG